MISTTNLTKKYGKRIALNNINLNVPSGALFGFLGSNGAGKTTTISILAGLVKKSSGEVIIDDKNLDHEAEQIKKSIGIMAQGMALFSQKSVAENLLYFALLKGMSKQDALQEIENLASCFGISSLLKRKGKQLSYGEEKLVLILQAFLNRPKLVLLDEPMSGFDPLNIVMLRDFFTKKSKECTIVFSSHNLSEVDKICSHIGILHEGYLLAQGRKDQLIKGKSLEKFVIEKLRSHSK